MKEIVELYTKIMYNKKYIICYVSKQKFNSNYQKIAQKLKKQK